MSNDTSNSTPPSTVDTDINTTTTTNESDSKPTISIPKHNLQLTIRPLRFTELWSASQTLARAFHTDPLFGAIIHPHRDRYPDDPALYYYRRMQRSWFDWSHTFFMATLQSPPPPSHSSSSYPNDSTGREIIAGVAQWDRLGSVQTRQRLGWGLRWYDPRRFLIRPLFVLFSYIANWFTPNRATDPNTESIIEDCEPYTEHYWSNTDFSSSSVGGVDADADADTHETSQREKTATATAGKDRSESWYLHILGVDPEYQGYGIGRRLAGWGIEQAQREGVTASVVAAEGKDVFYQRCGFTTCVGNANDGESNPLAQFGSTGGRIWFFGLL